jgi:hypothetical protein
MRQTLRARVPAANGAAVEPRAPTKEIDMTARWKTLTAGLVLGGTLSACDVAPEAGPPGAKPDQAARPDEGDQIPNTVARLEVGTSTVFFAEPAPGMIVIAEKSLGEKALTGATPEEPGALWVALAQGRPMPPALQEALARAKQLGAQRPVAAAGASEGEQIGETSADVPPDLGPDVLAANIGGEWDPAPFIDYYCSRYGRTARIKEGCWVNRTTSSHDLTLYSRDGDALFARAAVASYRGSFRFVPEWRAYFYWSRLADLWTDPGVSWEWRVSRTAFSFGFRYRLISAAGAGFHQMHFVDDNPIDPTGLGSHRIPINK